MHEYPLISGTLLLLSKSSWEWRILKVDEATNTMMVISEDIVAQRGFHDKAIDCAWEESFIRKWLNTEFVNENFSSEWQQAIVGEVQLLSVEEAEILFEDDEQRISYTEWQLNSVGAYPNKRAIVRADGTVDRAGVFVGCSCGIRPVIVFDLQADVFEPMLEQTSKGRKSIRMPDYIVDNNEIILANRDIVTVVIQDGVTGIREGAFVKCEHLSEVSIPDTVRNIGLFAFANSRIINIYFSNIGLYKFRSLVNGHTYSRINRFNNGEAVFESELLTRLARGEAIDYDFLVTSTTSINDNILELAKIGDSEAIEYVKRLAIYYCEHAVLDNKTEVLQDLFAMDIIDTRTYNVLIDYCIIRKRFDYARLFMNYAFDKGMLRVNQITRFIEKDIGDVGFKAYLLSLENNLRRGE